MQSLARIVIAAGANVTTGSIDVSGSGSIFSQTGGTITVNGRPANEYFCRQTSQMIVRQPLEVVEKANAFDVRVNVCGGGESGQAGAVRHGISRALLVFDPAGQPIPGAVINVTQTRHRFAFGSAINNNISNPTYAAFVRTK